MPQREMTAGNISHRHCTLCVYDFLVYDLHRTHSNVVHPADPHHLVACFELFRYTLPLSHLLHQPGEHGFGLLVNVSQVAAQLAAQLQTGVEGLAVLFDVPQVPLTPQADGLFFFCW